MILTLFGSESLRIISFAIDESSCAAAVVVVDDDGAVHTGENIPLMVSEEVPVYWYVHRLSNSSASTVRCIPTGCAVKYAMRLSVIMLPCGSGFRCTANQRYHGIAFDRDFDSELLHTVTTT